MEFKTKKEIAEELKCSEKTVDRLRKEGLPSYNLGGKLLFEKQEVFDWIIKNKKS
jgi:excisionase family DNA binding protein